MGEDHSRAEGLDVSINMDFFNDEAPFCAYPPHLPRKSVHGGLKCSETKYSTFPHNFSCKFLEELNAHKSERAIRSRMGLRGMVIAGF